VSAGSSTRTGSRRRRRRASGTPVPTAGAPIPTWIAAARCGGRRRSAARATTGRRGAPTDPATAVVPVENLSRGSFFPLTQRVFHSRGIFVDFK
jgi:hypothetical protein